jgi:septal ring-binding cell division protein DamX
VSTVETLPPAPATAPAERRCPRCGAQLSADQEWCLDCGTAVGTTIASPRGWRLPLAIVGALLALAAIALVLALVELAGPAERVTEVPATPTPAAAVPPVVPATPTPTAGATPEATASPAGDADLATWPRGRSAWTVILNSSGTREDAQRLATGLAAKGIPGVGVLDSDDFDSLGPDSFVVFSGQYPNREQAAEALATVRERAGGGSTRRIVPKRG